MKNVRNAMNLTLVMIVTLGVMLFISCKSYAVGIPKTKIAIIDTGFSPLPFDDTAFKICPKGHYDFSTDSPTLGVDNVGHGSIVAYLINKTSQKKNICFLVYKVFGGSAKVDSVYKAMMLAKGNGANYINMSLSVLTHSNKLEKATKLVTDSGIKIFVAAGNDSTNLNDVCNIFPQCFKSIKKNLYIVGATDYTNQVEEYSNIGYRIDVYKLGTIGDAHGTSFSAPRALGEYIRDLE